MMKIVNTTPAVLKHQIEEAIAQAVTNYRTDYPNDTGFTRKRTPNMETMVNLLLSMQGGSLKKNFMMQELMLPHQHLCSSVTSYHGLFLRM